MALFVFVYIGPTPIASVLTGWISSAAGSRVALLAGAAACLVAAGIAALVHTPPNPDAALTDLPQRPADHPLPGLGSDQGKLPEGLVVAVGQDRQRVVDMLRRLGYAHEAEEAARVLPDPVEMEQLKKFGDQHGISVSELTNRMGGSP